MIEVAYWNGLQIWQYGNAERVRRIGDARRATEVRVRRIGGNRGVRKRNGVVECTAIEGPGDVLLDQGIADRANRTTAGGCCRPTARRSADSPG